MNLTRDRMHTIGWGMTLVICLALTLALTFRVNAVKSEVRLADRRIAALQQEKVFLETEFQARASQQQLKAFNDVDFGYQAPTAEQYLENERQLAALGKPRSPDAPAPIRVASSEGVNSAVRLMPAVVSDAGKRDDEDKPAPRRKPAKANDLSAHLAELGHAGGRR